MVNETGGCTITLTGLCRNAVSNSNSSPNVGSRTWTGSLGFTTVEFDGVEIGTEYGVPANTGYGLAIGNVEMLNMEGQMFNSEGPFYDEISNSYRYVVSTLGNLKFKSPRSFIKWKNYA